MENITQSSAETNSVKEEYKFPKFLKYFYFITIPLQLVVLIFRLYYPDFPPHSGPCNTYHLLQALDSYVFSFSWVCLVFSFIIVLYVLFEAFKNKKASIFFIILALFCLQFILTTAPYFYYAASGIGFNTSGYCIPTPSIPITN